jgi:lipid-A-disaccharide synthase
MFIAGDPSGDEHAAAIIRQLKIALPGASLWGIGGPAMEKQGFAPVLPFAPFNRMGFLEVATHIGFFLGAKKRLIDMMENRRPDVLVCVDYPGFNMPMMKAARKRGIPVVWYIAPTVWAWKHKRAGVLGSHASHIAVIFPFEVPWFSPYRSPVTFVGNPTVEAMEREGAFAHGRKTHPGSGAITVALVPGSRRQETEHLLPRMISAFLLLKEKYPLLMGVVSRYRGLPAEIYNRAIGGAPVEIFDGPLRDMLRRADCALVTSGTATLETALLGVPQVIVYHTSPLTYAIVKRLVHIPHIGLPNIIAGEGIVPECIQDKATGVDLAQALERFIVSPEAYTATVDRLLALREKLGEKKPSIEMCKILKALAPAAQSDIK